MPNTEYAVIGLLGVGRSVPLILTETEADDFTDEACKGIYQIYKAHWREKGSTDFASKIVMMPDELKAVALSAINDVYPSVNDEEVLEEFKAEKTAERLRWQGTRLSLVGNVKDAAEIVEEINKIHRGRAKLKPYNMVEATYDFLMGLEEVPDYIRTGYSKIDENASIEKGDFVIIAGSPSAGKTCFSLNVLLNMAKQGKKCVYFSLETSPKKLFDRMITTALSLDFQKVKRRGFSKEEKDEITVRSVKVSDLPIEFVSASGRDVGWIKAETIRSGAEVIFVDYLQLVNGKGRDRFQMVSEVSMGLHTLAQTEGVTVIALSQLKRMEDSKRPTMSDLRESGQIEQDADLILMLHKLKNEQGMENGNGLDKRDLIIAKNKEGQTGTVRFVFEGNNQTFYQLDTFHGE